MDPSERTALIRQGRQLESEHMAHVKRAAILLDAESRWLKSLSAADRRNREYVLLALQSEKVPDRLKWGNFDRSCSKYLQNDREIFMQRLELDEFEENYKNHSYRVPDIFRDDKEVMIKVLSKHSQALSLASKELQNDRDVVMAAIQQRQPCAPQAIQHASKKLRGDKRIARALLQHEHGIKAFSHLAKKLQNDYKLALLAIKSSSEECSKSYEHLSELPEEMLDDPEIVFEAVKRRGSNLRYVTDKSLLEDIDLIMAACENDGAAIEFCPEGPIRDEMLQDYNLTILVENGGHCVLKELGEEYMLQRKFLIPAVENGMILPADFSRKLYEKDRPLFMDALRHSYKPFVQYDELPDEIRRDSNIGLAILKANKNDEESWAFRLTKDVPDAIVRTHIDKLLKIARDQYILNSHHGDGDTSIWDEKAIVVSLCKMSDCFRRVSARLKTDPDVARAAFSGDVSLLTLRVVPQTLFQQHHDIAAMALKALHIYGSANWNTRSEVFRLFGQTVATSRAVFLEWVRKGWTTRYHYGRTIPFANDRSVALEAIKNNQDGDVGDIFSQFSTRLRGNKTFMVSAVQANPEVLRLASDELLDDFDYMLRGVSVSRDVLKPFSHKDKEFDHLADFAAEVRARLAVTDGFVLHFFGAIALDPSGGKRKKRRRNHQGDDDRCHLRMLDFGLEAGAAIKRMIAEYAGIPVGPDLKLLRSALENLKFWGY